MNKVKKTALITILAVLCLGSVCFSAACASLDINVKTPYIIYRMGDNVDCYDFFQLKSGVNYNFSYKIDGGDKIEIEGHTFYLSTPGNYSLSCIAKSGLSKFSKTVDFEVYNKKSHMFLGESQINLNLGDKRTPRALMGLTEYIFISSVESVEYISQVKIYNNLDGTPTVYQLGKAEQTENGYEAVYTPTPDGFFNGRQFNFIYECEYVFTAVSETTGGKAQAEFSVIAKENFSKIPLAEGVSINYDEQNKTVSWGEVDGAVSYRVKIDLKNAYTEANVRSLDIEPYLVKEFQFFDLVVVAKNAAGEEFAKLAVDDVVIAPQGSKGLVLGYGANVNSQTQTATLIGTQVYDSGATMMSNMNTPHVAFAGDYGIGTYVDFVFSGNNLPNVAFFADQINGNITNEGGNAYLIMNGLYSANRGSSTSKTNVIGENRLICVGPDRFHKGASGKDPLHNYISASEMTREYLISENSLFTQKYLHEDVSGRTYKYTVGSFVKDGYLAFETKLYDNTTGDLVALASYKTSQLASEVVADNIIVYSTVKGSGENTVFQYSEPYLGTPENVTLYSYKTKVNEDGTVSIDGAVIKGSGYTSQMTENPESADLSVGYISFGEDYGVNNYLDITFTGKNMPSVMFFADQLNDDLTQAGGKGVLVSSGMLVNETVWRGDDSLFVYGPNRVPMSFDENKGLDTNVYDNNTWGYVYGGAKIPVLAKLNYSNYPLLTTKGLMEDLSGDQYKLTIGTFVNAGGNICIDVKLVNVTKNLVVYDTAIPTSLTQYDVEDGKIIIYGAVNGVEKSTTFKYTNPYQATPSNIKVASSGATQNEDGSITLAGKSFAGAGHLYQVANIDNSYIGIRGEYGVGTYLDVEFKGNNMPQVMFFANNFTGNMTNFEVTTNATGGYSSHTNNTNKGLIFTNGFFGSKSGNAFNNNGATDMFRVYGPNRITNATLVGSYRDLGGYLISKKYGVDTEFNALTQSGLSENYQDVNLKYTVGTFDQNGMLGIYVKLYDMDNGQTLVEFSQVTSVQTSSITASNIILYGTVKGSENPTTFKYSAPYQKQA